MGDRGSESGGARFDGSLKEEDNYSQKKIIISTDKITIFLVGLLFLASHGAMVRVGPANGIVWFAATIISLVWFVRFPVRMSKMIAENWAIFLLPAYSTFSTIWSASPSTTLLNSVQMLIAIIVSLRIVDLLSTRQIMQAMAFALGSATLLSIMNLVSGLSSPVYEVNGAFLGIFAQKNNFAKAVFWFAFSLAALSLMNRRPVAGICILVSTLPLTFMASSRTGQMGYIFILMLYLLVLSKSRPVRVRFTIVALLVITFAILCCVYTTTGGSLVADLLHLMGKNPTMTGRTVIWGLGISTWQENWLVGIGLNAFWTSPAYAREVFYISSNVDDGLRGFHNVYIEYLVALGILGASFLIWLMALAWTRLVRLYLTTQSVEAAIWLSILTALIVFGGFEDSFSKPRSGHFILAIMAFSYSKKRIIKFG